MKVFEVKNLTFEIKNHRILSDISFSVEKGRWLLIAGPNGAGKSTLLKIVQGIWKKQKGVIKIWGKEIEKYKRTELAKKMATLSSEFYPMYNINVYEFIKLGTYAKEGFFSFYSKRTKKDVELAIEIADVKDILKKGILELSQGEMQRVRIAKILAQNPEIMLFDEPLVHLDIKHKLWVLELFAKLRASGKTIITVIHDFSISFPYPDAFLLLKNGNIVFHGNKDKRDDVIEAFGQTFEVRLYIRDNFLLPYKG